MADQGFAPQKRRRSNGMRPTEATGEQIVQRLSEVHGKPTRAIVTIEAVVIAYPEEVELQVKTHVGEEGKSLANVLMCDDEMVVLATLWGDVAIQAIACIKSLMEACAEEEFPRVRLSAVEVVAYRHPTTPVLKKVQSTMATTVSFLSRMNVRIQPCMDFVTQNLALLALAPKVGICHCWVREAGEMRYSQKGHAMLDLAVVDRGGQEARMILFGSMAEESVHAGDEIVAWYCVAQESLQDQSGALWLYPDGYLLTVARGATPPAVVQKVTISGNRRAGLQI